MSNKQSKTLYFVHKHDNKESEIKKKIDVFAFIKMCTKGAKI